MKLHRPRTYWRLFKRAVYGEAGLAEPRVMRVLKRIHGEIFVDVGANSGIYTIPLASHFRRVYAFEPHPDIWNILKQNTGKLSNVTIIESAVADKDGATEFYLDALFPAPNPPTGSANTILKDWHYKPASHPNMEVFYKGEDSFQVKTCSLDSFFQSVKIIDLVKIDVEGAEFLVLDGARELLEEKRLFRVMVELHNRDRKGDLVRFFGKLGYRGRWVDADHFYATPSS